MNGEENWLKRKRHIYIFRGKGISVFQFSRSFLSEGGFGFAIYTDVSGAEKQFLFQAFAP